MVKSQPQMEEANICRLSWQILARSLRKKKLGTLMPMNNLALLLHDQGKLAEAETLYFEALCVGRVTLDDEILNPDAWKYPSSWFNVQAHEDHALGLWHGPLRYYVLMTTIGLDKWYVARMSGT